MEPIIEEINQSTKRNAHPLTNGKYIHALHITLSTHFFSIICYSYPRVSFLLPISPEYSAILGNTNCTIYSKCGCL